MTMEAEQAASAASAASKAARERAASLDAKTVLMSNTTPTRPPSKLPPLTDVAEGTEQEAEAEQAPSPEAGAASAAEGPVEPGDSRLLLPGASASPVLSSPPPASPSPQANATEPAAELPAAGRAAGPSGSVAEWAIAEEEEEEEEGEEGEGADVFPSLPEPVRKGILPTLTDAPKLAVEQSVGGLSPLGLPKTTRTPREKKAPPSAASAGVAQVARAPQNSARVTCASSICRCDSGVAPQSQLSSSGSGSVATRSIMPQPVVLCAAMSILLYSIIPIQVYKCAE